MNRVPVCLWLVMAVLVGGGLMASRVDGAEINLMGLTSTASNYYGGWEPSKANDGNVNTAWMQPGCSAAWWEVDLGVSYTITGVRLFRQSEPVNTPLTFHLEFDAGQRYPSSGTIAYTPFEAESVSQVIAPGIPSQHVRVVLDSDYYGCWGTGLQEVQLWEGEAPEFPAPTPTPTVTLDPPGQLDLRNAYCSASTFCGNSSAYRPANALDFNLGTCWLGQYRELSGATWEVDLGGSHTITAARLYNVNWGVNHIHHFHLECDGQRRPAFGSYLFAPEGNNDEPFTQIITPVVTTTRVGVVIDDMYFGAEYPGLTELQLWEGEEAPVFPPPTPTPTVVLDPPGQMDLRGKLCSVSSFAGNNEAYRPVNAVDFNWGTCWLGQYGELSGATWEVDLGGSHTITAVRLYNVNWGVNHIHHFHLECDGQRCPAFGSYLFTPEGNNDEPFTQLITPAVTTTRVDVVIDDMYFGAEYPGLTELQLWEGEEAPLFPPPTPTPTVVLDPPGQMDLRGKLCTVSSFAGNNEAYRPVNAVDFNFNTYWLTQYGELSGATWEVDFGASHTVTAVRLYNDLQGGDHIRDFHLECDGQRRPLAGSYRFAPEPIGNDGFAQLITPPVATTHVRVVIDNMYFGAQYCGLTECQLWEGTAPEFPPPTATPTVPLLPGQLDMRGYSSSSSSFANSAWLPLYAKDFDPNRSWFTNYQSADAWWEVDLETPHNIDKVRIYDLPWVDNDIATYHLEFDNGQRRPTEGSYTYAVPGGEYDENEFETVTTSRVRVVLDTAYAGALGLQEVYVFEAPATPTPTASPTDTPSATPTDTPTGTPSDTPTSTPTATPSETPTSTPTAAAVATPTKTRNSLGMHTQEWQGLP